MCPDCFQLLTKVLTKMLNFSLKMKYAYELRKTSQIAGRSTYHHSFSRQHDRMVLGRDGVSQRAQSPGTLCSSRSTGPSLPPALGS